METPVLVVNFKTYQNGSGHDAIELAEVCDKVKRSTDKNIVLAVQNADIDRISSDVDIPVFAQHMDSESFGANTGSDIGETLVYNGAEGALINHSEDQVETSEIKKRVERCKKLGITSIVCVDCVKLGKKVESFSPDFIAYEPPELIGGDVSVSKAKPEILGKMVDSVETPVLTGAGVKDAEDVIKSEELGAVGVLVASGVVKSEDPENAVKALVSPF